MAATAENVAESVWTRLIARFAMIATPFIVAIVGSLTFGYLDTRFDQQRTYVEQVSVRVDRLEHAATDAAAKTEVVATKAAVLENNQVLGRDRNARAQDQINAKLDTIQNSIADLREKVAGIAAHETHPN